MSEFQAKESRERCLRFRKRILDLSQGVSALHIGGAFSCMELVETAYFHLMRRDSEGKSQDTFLMSKGHGCLAQYVSLEELGVLSTEELNRYCTPEAILGVHPDYGNPGIEISSGSLGHGMGMALGMARGDTIRGEDRVIYIVMSDGELQEGSVWEAMVLAPSLGLTNIVGFLDLNNFQSLGKTDELLPNFYPVREKVEAFGWEAAEVNGHNSEEIYQAVRNRSGSKPLMVIGKTIKGKGVSYMENVPLWHYRSPSPEEYKLAMSELKEISG